MGPPAAHAAMTVSSAAGRRTGPSDRVFKWIAAAAGACLVGFVLFVVVRGPSHAAGGPGTAARKPPPPVLKAGTAAPAFSLPALNGGTRVALARYRGTPVIVNFFASWCTDCRSELPALASVAQDAAGRVAVVGVDSNENSTARARRLLAAAHATYPVAIDRKAKVAAQYLVSALPVTYFLDARGRVVGASLGAQTVSSLQRWVSRLEAQR